MKKINTFWPVSIFFILAALPLIFYLAPAEPTLWANSHHNRVLDFFFKYTTKIAEWPVVVTAILLAFTQHWKTGLWVGICYGLEAIVVSTIKLALKAPRPSMETGISALHQVEGEFILSWYSFPSGHTAAAFVGFGFLSFMTGNRVLQALCALGAILVGYSRMYLGQHYLLDLLGGATIAILILGLYRWTHPKVLRLQWRKYEG